MKKCIAFMLTLMLVLSLAACGTSNSAPAVDHGITMQEIYDANQLDTLLKNYENYCITYMAGDEVISQNFGTADYAYEYFDGGISYVTDHAYYYMEGDFCQRMLYLTSDGLLDLAAYRASEYGSPIVGDETLRESIQSVTREDERITVKTISAQEDVDSMAAMSEGLVSISCEYLLDAKTYNPITIEVMFDYEDGNTDGYHVEFAYNTDIPEEVQLFQNYDNQKDDLRTITLVFHTEDGEKTEQIQSPKGLSVGLGPVAGLEGTHELYSDAACTEPFVSSGDLNADVTIHLKWIA